LFARVEVCRLLSVGEYFVAVSVTERDESKGDLVDKARMTMNEVEVWSNFNRCSAFL
jgi:hypothetical protein